MTKQKTAYLAAEEGFSTWRNSLPIGLGALTAIEAYAHYRRFEIKRSREPMTFRAFGLRARVAFGASLKASSKKRQTRYINVGPASSCSAGGRL